MALYTKTGDGGETDRGDAQRVHKSDRRIVAMGEVDELNAHVGLCLQGCSAAGDGEIAGMLRPIQGELMALAAVLAGRTSGGEGVDESAPARMEGQIDSAWELLPPLEHFVLPGGCELACRLHLARTVCRRAERAIVAHADAGGAVPPTLLRYLNRLSDLLFALARLANYRAGIQERTWTHPK